MTRPRRNNATSSPLIHTLIRVIIWWRGARIGQQSCGQLNLALSWRHSRVTMAVYSVLHLTSVNASCSLLRLIRQSKSGMWSVASIDKRWKATTHPSPKSPSRTNYSCQPRPTGPCACGRRNLAILSKSLRVATNTWSVVWNGWTVALLQAAQMQIYVCLIRACYTPKRQWYHTRWDDV